MKSEPAELSIDDLARAPEQTVAWTGVRNYQARNFIRDDMARGDGVLFYHSSCALPGIAGLACIAGPATADLTQWDPSSPYFDPKQGRNSDAIKLIQLEVGQTAPTYNTPGTTKPRWLQIDVKLVCKTRLLSLKEMQQHPALHDMHVLKRGNRLSITRVSPAQWDAVLRILGVKETLEPGLHAD
jgi:predicted RNA-binding protein with PUA-like domain